MQKNLSILPDGRIIEEDYPSSNGENFTNVAVYTSNRIINYGVSDNAVEGSRGMVIVILEGDFQYPKTWSSPRGWVTGNVKSMNPITVSYRTTSDISAYTIYGNIQRVYFPNSPSITDYYSPENIQSGNSTFTYLDPIKISGRETQAGQDLVNQILNKTGGRFEQAVFAPVESWIQSPQDFNVLNEVRGSGNEPDGETPPNKNELAIVATINGPYSESYNPDPITNFHPKSQKIRIDSDPFGISGDYEVDFRVAKSSKQLKKLQKSDFNLIYNRKDGSLYYNINREEVGFGDRGGLIAILDPKLPLTAANFEIF